MLLVGCNGVPESSRVTHGPILGRPSSTSMTIWARLSADESFHVHYGRDADHLEGQATSSPVRIDDDLTGFCTLEKLESGARYFYEVHAASCSPDEVERLRGSFRTLPDSQGLRDPKHNPRGLFNFSFEFACGNNQDPAHGIGPSLPVYDTLLRDVRDEVLFAILNGDWLYEEDRAFSAEAWAEACGVSAHEVPDIVQIAPTVAGIWENYKTYLARADNLAEWHRHVPSFYTFDDHEILNDVFGSGTAGYRNRRAVFRDIAVRGWFDYLGWANPVANETPADFGRAKLTKGSDVLQDDTADFSSLDVASAATLHVHWGTPDAGVKDIPTGDVEGGDPNANVYDIVEVLDAKRLKIRPSAVSTGTSSYSIGRDSHGTFRVGNCRFLLLDTRTHRQLHDVKDPAKKGLSMLGDRQREWLIEWMKKGDADFYFVVSSVNFMVPHVGGGGAAFDAATKDDAWTVFLDEREKLIEFWDALEQPVFVLTGDLHNSFAVKITDNVWEFASGPHNSVNHRPEDEGMRPVNGPFQYGPRACDIRWSTTALGDIPRENRLFPHFCVVQINNVFNNPRELGGTRWIAYPRPHVIFRFYDALTGELRYAETIHAK
jgi:phosphodiesterase/alkaline phosphatase D-like protein